MIMECVKCGKEYELDIHSIGIEGFCSKRCYYDNKNVKKKKPENRKCKYCGRVFQTTQPNHKYCSSKCTSAAYKLRYHNSYCAQSRAPYAIYNRDGFTCAYCGKTSYGDHIKLSLDHVIPKKLGGTDKASNLITSCSQCNSSKGATKPQECESIIDEIAKRNEYCGIHPDTIIRNEIDIVSLQIQADT